MSRVLSASAMSAAYIFFASSVFKMAASAAVAKSFGAPRATGSGMALNGRAGADLFEDEFLLLEDAFDEPESSLSASLVVNEGDAAPEAVASSLLSALGRKETSPERSTDKFSFFGLCLNLMTLYLFASGCHRLHVERLAAKMPASAEEESNASLVAFSDIAEAIREDQAGRLADMLALAENLPKVQDSYGCTALHLAVQHGAEACLRLLLAQGCGKVDVDAKDAWEETPLHFAARRGNVAACELLLAHGAFLNALNSSDEAPLMTAGKAGSSEVCDFLLAQGAIVGDCDDVAIPAALSAALLCRLIRD